MRPQIFSLAFLCLSSIAVSAERFPSITIQGNYLKSACSIDEWKKVEESIFKLEVAQISNELVTLINTYLCKKGKVSNQFLRQHIPKRIPLVIDDTDGKSRTYISPSEVSALGGRAWDFDVFNSGPNITIQYLSNEACAESATFSFKANTWLIVAKGKGCD